MLAPVPAAPRRPGGLVLSALVLDLDPLDALDALVAHVHPPADRYERASEVLHDIRLRLRRAERAAPCLHRCPACTRDLPHEAYTRDARRPCGIEWRCRECRNAATVAARAVLRAERAAEHAA